MLLLLLLMVRLRLRLRLLLLLLLPMTTTQQDLLVLGGCAGCSFLLLPPFVPAAQLLLQLGVGRRHPVLVGLEEIASETEGLDAAAAQVDQAPCTKNHNRSSIESSMNKSYIEENLYKSGTLTERRSGRRRISVSSRSVRRIACASCCSIGSNDSRASRRRRRK